MMPLLREFLTEQPIALLFVILAAGYLVGKARIKGFEVGAVTGVLFAGLLFGHLGYEFEPALQTLGFFLFIFSVGFQAGPSFFEVLRTEGAKYFALSISVAATGFALAAWLAGLFEFPIGTSAGLLGGAMTTTPTLAAAQDALQSGVALPEGVGASVAVRNVTTAYAITYLFGLVGLLAMIRLVPQVLGVDVPAEARKVGGEPSPPHPAARISVRAYRIERDALVGVPYREILEQLPPGASLARLRRQGEWIEIDEETVLEPGDEVTVVGRLDRFVEAPSLIGPELSDAALLALDTESARIVVTRREGVGLDVGQLQATERYGCFLTEVTRLQVALPVEPSLSLHRGDILDVTGPRAQVEALAARLGFLERPLIETDLLTLAIGIAAGIAIGMVSIAIAGLSIGLGTAGGLLTTGLVIGYLRSIHPTFGRMPGAARWIFMELGLQMFMAGVGVSAGGGIVETLTAVGPALVLCGAIVTVAPVVVGWGVGRYLLGLNPALLLGAIAGAMTSGAALSTVNSVARSTVPSLGYTGAYAFANVILTVAGTLIVRL